MDLEKINGWTGNPLDWVRIFSDSDLVGLVKEFQSLDSGVGPWVGKGPLLYAAKVAEFQRQSVGFALRIVRGLVLEEVASRFVHRVERELK